MHSLDDEEAKPGRSRRLLSQRIAEQLRSQIETEYAPGDRLPGENALMAQHSISRTTARAALAILQNEGLVKARRGVGVFVQAPALSIAIPAGDPHEAAVILRRTLDQAALDALVAELTA